ncbi:MAG: hypothetical protein M1839_008507 [Geoglossum umbratile]|nr:MAG: hypothetical protein M1839_008507 [Geoglossum umbratile]
MSNPPDPAVADPTTTQNASTEKVGIPSVQTDNGPSVPPPNEMEEAAAAVATESSTAAATETITIATPAAADTVEPAADVSSSAAEQEPNTTVKTPFTAPLPVSQPSECAPLTADQEIKCASVLTAVSAWTTVPTTSAKNAPTVPITDEERLFLTRECLLRYLRATKWNVADAQKRLLGTLTWRREYGVLEHTPEYIGVENETGKQVILGYDNACRPCLYLLPQHQNTPRTERQVQHLVFMLERMIDLMVPGQETLSLLVNFKNSGNSSPNIAQGRHVLSILQNHYPERLGRAFVINVPWAVWGFFKIITPFIDPLTREKMKFNEDLRQHVPPAQLTSAFGGDVDFQYDHAIYWPTLVEVAGARRAEYTERWVKGGKRIGEYEGYLKGRGDKSLSEVEGAQQAASLPDSTEKIPETVPAVEALKISAE